MRRSLIGLFACCLLSASACTETIITKKASGSPPPAASPTEEPEQDAGPAPAPGNALVIDLGTVTAGTDVTFDVPAGALGFNIVMDGDAADFDQDKPYGIQRIVDPSGTVVHDKFTPVGGTNPTSTAAFDTLAAASVPQSEAAGEPIAAGKWTVLFGVQGDSTAKPKVSAKVRIQSSGDGKFHGGTLDLHVHVPAGLQVDGTTVDPAKASTDARLKQRLDTFFSLTSNLLGIDRGEVVFHTAKSNLADVADLEIIDAFGVSSPLDDGKQALHVLLTNSISQGGQQVAAGISPGIPGAATVFGRGASGIIVATVGGSDEDALTMLHEAGHFFGLNHTTEFDGQSSDPLSDTPKCTNISGGNLQSCPDRTNIMFPAGAIDGPVTLSATQKRVYRGSPIYKATPAAAQGTMAYTSSAPLPTITRRFRTSGLPLSAVERELSLGYCGLVKIDANAIVRRYGATSAIAQLKAAAADPDLSPIIRGRANVALRSLGVTP